MTRRLKTFAACALVIAAAAAVLTLVIVHRPANAKPIAGIPGVSAEFSLTTSDGRTVSDRTYRGKWLLVYFGFTVCPEVCPTVLLSIGGALDALGPKGRDVQPLFITIDPARDTQAVMAAYMTSFDPRIVGLVGTQVEIDAVSRNYRSYVAMRNLGRGEVAIDHSSYIYVVDPQGKVATILTGDLPGHSLADALRDLIR